MKLWGFGKRNKKKSEARQLENKTAYLRRKETTSKFCCDTCGKTYQSWASVAGVVSNPCYKEGDDDLAKGLFPLKYKALYALCISCVKMLDHGFNGTIEAKLDKMPAVWGVLSCCVDQSGNIVPMKSKFNYTRPVNMMRLRMIKSISGSKTWKRRN